MSRTEGDPLGADFGRRLRVELDRVQPRYSSPRYASTKRPAVFGGRLAPVALAAAVTALFGLTASVATGSANPAVWTEAAVKAIHPIVTSTPTPTPEEHQTVPAPAPAAHEPEGSTEPSERPEPPDRAHSGDSQEPDESPDPARYESGHSSGSQ